MTIKKDRKINHKRYSIKRGRGSKLNNTNIKYIQIGGDVACNSVLGAGGFGIAYKCVDDSKPNNPTIIAVLKTSKVKDDTVLQNEIDILSKLQANNNVIHYITADEIKQHGLKNLDMPHYYLEYCANGDLKYYLSKQQSNSPEQIFTQIFAGLRHLYNNNIIHADIKEENILVCGNITGNPTFKIADFGISIDLNSFDENIDRNKLFKNGSIGYIPMYMRYTTYFRDLYALYCILYKMITGKPFNDITKLAGAVSARIIEETDISKEQSNTINRFMMQLIELQDKLLENNYFNPDISVSKPNNQQQQPAGYVMASPGGPVDYKATGGSGFINGYILASPGGIANNNKTLHKNTQHFDIVNQPLLMINKTSDHELYKDIYGN